MATQYSKLRYDILWIQWANRRNGIALGIAIASIFARGCVYFGSGYGNLFSGADSVGRVFAWASEAYIASYIFFLIIVRVKEKASEIHLRPYVKNKVRDLLDMHFEMINFLEARAGQSVGSVFPSAQDIDSLYQKLDSSGRSAVQTFFNETVQRIVFWHNLLYKMAHHIDTELILLLTEIEDGDFAKGNVLNAEAFWEYQVELIKLRKYYERRFKIPFEPKFVNTSSS